QPVPPRALSAWGRRLTPGRRQSRHGSLAQPVGGNDVRLPRARSGPTPAATQPSGRRRRGLADRGTSAGDPSATSTTRGGNEMNKTAATTALAAVLALAALATL